MSNDTANDSGRDLFASFREVAWHGLGTVFESEVTDYREMLTLAGLDSWNVRKVPVYFGADAESSDVVEFPGHYATVRDSHAGEIVPMGMVGNRYEPTQNEDAFSVLQSLSDGARWETAGALGSTGATVFGSLAFERETVLDPTGVADTIKSYALVSTSHDGTGALTFGLTPVRVVCQNTLNMALGKLSNSFKIRHTSTAMDRAELAAEVWRKENAYFDAFETEAAALFAAKISDKQYANMVTTLFPKPEEDVKGSLTKWENKQGMYTQAWNGAPNAGIKGTAWGALNALTEANQWGRGQRDSERGAEAFAMAGAGFDGPTNTFRQNALTLVKARAGIK